MKYICVTWNPVKYLVQILKIQGGYRPQEVWPWTLNWRKWCVKIRFNTCLESSIQISKTWSWESFQTPAFILQGLKPRFVNFHNTHKDYLRWDTYSTRNQEATRWVFQHLRCCDVRGCSSGARQPKYMKRIQMMWTVHLNHDQSCTGVGMSLQGAKNKLWVYMQTLECSGFFSYRRSLNVSW